MTTPKYSEPRLKVQVKTIINCWRKDYVKNVSIEVLDRVVKVTKDSLPDSVIELIG